MRTRLFAAFMLTIYLLIMIVPVCYAGTEEGETAMENIDITLNRMHNRCLCSWEKPSAEGNGDYTVIVEAVDESGNAREAIRAQAYYSYFDADHYVAYVCQEEGFPYRMRVRVQYYNGEDLAAEGVSDTFDPREVFPEKEVLEFGKDIPLDSIKYLSWDSAGMSIEANWHMGVSHYGDEYTFYTTRPGQNEKEKKIKKSDWDQVVAIIAKGKVKRDRIMDPDMVELDGGGEGFAIAWEDDEHENWQTYYSYVADEETAEELQKWLKAKDKTVISGWKLWALIPAFVVAAAGAAVMFFKK